MNAPKAIAVAFGAVAAVAGCTLIYDAGDFETGTDAAVDAAEDDAAEVGPPPVDPCDHARPPIRPDATSPGTTRRAVFALEHLALVAGNADTVGFDLDGVCTCDTRPFSAGGGAPSCVPRRPEQIPCDGTGGRDNGAASLFARLVPNRADAGVDVGFDLSAAEGVETVLLELDEYEGGLDDAQVFVGIYDSPGLDAYADCDGGAPFDASTGADGGRTKPRWTGCDAWRVSKGAVLDGRPLTFTRNAWVTNGQLVARLDVLRLRLGRAELLLHDAVLVAKLDRSTAPGKLVAGVLAGRASSSDMLRTFGEQEVGTKPLCKDALSYGAFRAAACNSLDLGSSGDAGATCDSLSVTAQFDAVEARRGTIAEPGDAASACGDLGDLGRCP